MRVEHDVDIQYAHVADDDWLGHNGVIRFTPAGDVVIVLSNAGDAGNRGCSEKVNQSVLSAMALAR